ncbi:MAG: thiamine biosynthesis protein ThiS [Thermoprotei archaeon]|nr:MAG: thiamine biosynthesis protein ThiS [Thermoprotei archaeon]RLF16063.1 MAG: thiamine biosynthesis protein ThiS [Thermoprotei archaeon]
MLSLNVGLRSYMEEARIKVEVKVKPGGATRSLEVKKGAKVKDLLKSLGYTLGTAVAVREGEVLSEDEALVDGDRLEVYEAISGGLGEV